MKELLICTDSAISINKIIKIEKHVWSGYYMIRLHLVDSKTHDLTYDSKDRRDIEYKHILGIFNTPRVLEFANGAFIVISSIKTIEPEGFNIRINDNYLLKFSSIEDRDDAIKQIVMVINDD